MSQTLLLGRKLNDDIVLPVAVDASGFLLVSNTNQPYLATLTDVSLNGVTNRQVLMYETASSLWKNGTIQTSDLSGQITNAQLQNSSVTVAGKSVSLGGSTTVSLDDLSDVVITAAATNNILRYTAPNWVNYTPVLPDFLSYIFPSVSQNIGVATLATATRTQNTINITETLNDWTGLATNTFRVTGLTNAVYRFTGVMGFRRTTTSDVAFFLVYTEGSNSSSELNTRIALAQESSYTANANGSCTMSFIRDFRTSLPAFVHFSFQNQSADAAQLVIQCNYILIERIYNV